MSLNFDEWKDLWEDELEKEFEESGCIIEDELIEEQYMSYLGQDELRLDFTDNSLASYHAPEN